MLRVRELEHWRQERGWHIIRQGRGKHLACWLRHQLASFTKPGPPQKRCRLFLSRYPASGTVAHFATRSPQMTARLSGSFSKNWQWQEKETPSPCRQGATCSLASICHISHASVFLNGSTQARKRIIPSSILF